MIPVLTLDGPSGVGKGTVASIIAQKLDWHLLDSGAIYRAFAIVAGDNDINIDDIVVMMVAEDGQVQIFEKKTIDYVDKLETMMDQFYENLDVRL